MGRVEVNIDDIAADEVHAEEAVFEDAPPPGSGKRRSKPAIEIEIEREVTKRQLIQSVSSIVVVVLYMLFTLLRDRDAGVVVIDPDAENGADDWAE